MEYCKSKVILDTTLAELFAQDSQVNDRRTVLVPYYWCSDLDYTDSISKTSKYLYQGTSPPNTSSEIRELVIQCLSLESQRFTFAAGKMETVLFDFEHQAGRLDAIRTLSVLPESQRPEVTFVAGIDDLMRKKSKSQLVIVAPHERFSPHRQTIDPDVLYQLLSKRCLALSGLPTPQTAILDLDDCSGSVDRKLSVAASWIRGFGLPRVFKTQQGMSSFGTFLVRTELEREDLIQSLLGGVLRTTLESVNSANIHLKPSTLLSQQMISQCSACFSTSFFVRKNGDFTFLGACRQDFSESNIWLGASICYLEQDWLQQRLCTIICQTSRYLHERGYHGPAGADIIVEDADGLQPSRQWIVDLNVRMTGSLTLAFLRGHFSVKRGLHEACITQRFKLPLKRVEFCKAFAREIREGRLIIVAWFHDTTSGFSWANLIVGAEDGLELKRLMGMVKARAV
ncbi:hypothetical protein EPUS_06864 [Endocarpon pusillum Z07020]|uniref:ATP-grasp domain-containing protein n=1 Tax=Endocarpon pusillum (strain Z07020 / HMAS-L-300199) TaxID=1263415 RepID=U1GXY4_ENDPU|nr:uncharacterized protein EPUS_06864 [Endocarpon pusillum Z07020]ERF76996.1 hypothetical protein EPUS_06864 [Endocarpon pusillum Z07020]